MPNYFNPSPVNAWAPNNVNGSFSAPGINYGAYPYNSNQITVAFVQGEMGANNYPVAAGNTVLLIDFDSKKFWLKTTESNGFQQTMRSFDFTEKAKTPNVTKQEECAFVTKEEFSKLEDYLKEQFESLKKNRFVYNDKKQRDNRVND